MINTEKLGPDLGLATGDPGVRTFDLGTPFLSLSLLYAILIWATSFILLERYWTLLGGINVFPNTVFLDVIYLIYFGCRL
jgi:hypothetical protein